MFFFIPKEEYKEYIGSVKIIPKKEIIKVDMKKINIFIRWLFFLVNFFSWGFPAICIRVFNIMIEPILTKDIN